MRFRVVFPVASGADCPNSSNHWMQEQQLLTFTEFCCYLFAAYASIFMLALAKKVGVR